MSTKLADTGERMVPEYHQGQLFYGEHIVRYRATQPLVKDLVVLDIASGSGYGTNMLAQTAKKVYGVDINESAIDYAKDHFSRSNIEYKLGNATKIPLDDASVDAVVSFETIEHVEKYREFLAEVKRVLKPDGFFVLSTPNNAEYPETNPFHVHEFSFDELHKLLKTQFAFTADYFQATWFYTALLSRQKLTAEWEEKVATIQTTPLKTNQSVYFVTICSDQKIDAKIPSLGALGQYSSIRLEEGRKLKIDKLAAAVKDLRQELKNSQQHSADLATELDQIKNSRTWRLRSRLVKTLGR